MSELEKSWSAISPKAALNYLDYYPAENKTEIARFIKNNKLKTALELGCGNCTTYLHIAKSVDIDYTGVDFSEPLIQAAKERTKNKQNCRIVKQDIFKYLEKCSSNSFDIIIISHVMELVESQELLLAQATRCSKYIAILWFEPPSHDFHTVELKPSAHPKDSDNAPYLRIKTGSSFYKHIVEKYGLKVMQKNVNRNHTKDLLHILCKK